MAKMKNQREFTRSKVIIKAEVVSDGTVIWGQVRDVSLRGMCFICGDLLPVNAECAVRIFLGEHRMDSPCIEGRGRVARTFDTGISIEFTEIGLDAFEHLQNLIRLNASNVLQVEEEFESHWGLKKAESP